MKKKLFVIAMAMLLLAGVTAGTVAYFTTKTVAHNVITTGEIDIELVETMKTPEGEKEWDDQTGIMPGQEVSKIVRVHNVGPNPAWVRVKVTKSVKVGNTILSDDVLTMNFNTDQWQYKDGYYYYKEALKAENGITVPLFTNVHFAGAEMGNDYQNARIEISVQAEGIQYQNNTNFDTAWPTGVEILKNIF